MEDRPGIIAELAGIFSKQISLEAVLQLPSDSIDNLPFVITVEPSSEQAVREAVAQMNRLDFLREPQLALPMEPPLWRSAGGRDLFAAGTYRGFRQTLLLR